MLSLQIMLLKKEQRQSFPASDLSAESSGTTAAAAEDFVGSHTFIYLSLKGFVPSIRVFSRSQLPTDHLECASWGEPHHIPAGCDA